MNTIISSDITKAVEFLSQDELVAIPTETVYGLAGNIFSEVAVKKIFETKQRPLFNPLIVHLHSIDQVGDVAIDFPSKAKLLAEKFWPGSLTMVLKKSDRIPDLITAGKDTVAIRIPNHPITLELLRQLPFPLAAPSANPFNHISPTQSSHVASYFGGKIPMILEGGHCDNGIESTIVGFDNEDVLVYRLGSIAIEDIEAIVGSVQVVNKAENTPDAPGMLAKHYAPRTKTVLVDDVESFASKHADKKLGILVFTLSEALKDMSAVETLSKTGNLAEAAANLYGALHRLDQEDLDLIIAERLPDYGLGRSMNDRLKRAASE